MTFSVFDFSEILFLDSSAELRQCAVLVDGFLKRRHARRKLHGENAEKVTEDEGVEFARILTEEVFLVL